jgi:hypothetical protein
MAKNNETVDVAEVKELNLEQKVTIKNIAGWTVGFKRIEGDGDVTIPPEGTTRLSRSEIIAQVQNGNRLLTGTDNRGSHATVYTDDAPTRVELDFDIPEENITQQVLTSDAVKKLFEYKTMKSFEDKLRQMVVTRAEKYAILQIIKKEKFNDFEKIRAVENYTGFKM